MRQRILRAVGILLGALVLWIALLFAAGAVVDSRVPIDLPPLSNVNVVNDRYVSAKGTWVIDGERQAAPLQTTEIICEVFVDTAPTCADYIFTIDFSTKAVSGLRKKKPNGPSVPADCNTLDKELRLSLRSGFKVSLSLKDEALPWFGHLAISPFKLLRTAP
jgi:hypothetical protein